ncbi:MAG: hypothetical protein AMXMBFR57_04610 [Acidimicrobiia bacterium]
MFDRVTGAGGAIEVPLGLHDVSAMRETHGGGGFDVNHRVDGALGASAHCPDE